MLYQVASPSQIISPLKKSNSIQQKYLKEPEQSLFQTDRTYRNLTNEEAEQRFQQRFKVIKDHVQSKKKKVPLITLKKSGTVNFLQKSQLSMRFQSQKSDEQSARKQKLLLDIQKLDQEIHTEQTSLSSRQSSFQVGRSKGQELYELAAHQRQKQALRKQIYKQEQEEQEMQECTFSPYINKSRQSPQFQNRSYSQQEYQLDDNQHKIDRIQSKYQGILDMANRLSSRLV